MDYKTQAHAKVCEEKMIPIETILQLKVEFEGSYRNSGEAYQDDILMDDSPQHKGMLNKST